MYKCETLIHLQHLHLNLCDFYLATFLVLAILPFVCILFAHSSIAKVYMYKVNETVNTRIGY